MDSDQIASRPRRTLRAVTATALVLIVTFTGCTLCQDCGDLDYPTYGGSWQRTRRDSGRVGSVFDPAGARTATLSDRDSDSEDTSIRGPQEQIGSGIADEEADEKSDDAEADSPSDRTEEMDKLRELDLEDINYQESDLMPPDV